MIIRTNRVLLYFVLLITPLLVASCNSKKKNTPIKRAYHNVTAKYNGYFNAKQRVIMVAKQTAESHTDKFDEILPVFPLGNELQAKAAFGPMDEAIKKASLVIQRHEISKWIDDCYLVIGQAYFYKRDYFAAVESFRFVAGKYKNTHSGNEAYVWMIKSYLELNKLTEAESIINLALDSKTFPKSLMPELYAAAASYNIKKQAYPKAIEYLEKAIPIEKRKAKRSRYTYIVAQLAERTNNENKAVLNYQRVLKMNPPYEMAFNAKINSARLFQGKTMASKKELEKQLSDLLKDDKNKEYKDQIYYALANIYEREGDNKKAIQYYKLSAASSIGNLAQKGLSFYKMATIYYDQTDYEPAQVYYDSTATFMSKTHADYDLVMSRKNSLAVLVRNLRVIALEDSLQTLARMPEKERLAAIDKVVKRDLEEKLKKEEEERILKESITQNITTNRPQTSGGASTPGANWYFYNTSAVSLGYSDFLKRFGRRPLEDNWRRVNKESFASLGNDDEKEETGGDASKEEPKNEQEKLRAKYLKNIPATEEQLSASTDKIIQAYYNIGTFYREDLINYNQSIRYYETMLKKYPDNRLKLEAYFNLYRLYLNVKNTSQSNYYKNKLLNDYPTSVFAKVIMDPDYISESKETEKQAESYYDNAYQLYTSGDYVSVIARYNEQPAVYRTTRVAAQFAYLHALSIGKTRPVAEFDNALKDVVTRFPGTNVSESAKEVIAKIVEMKNPETVKKDVEEEIYLRESRAKYFYVIAVDVSATTRETKLELSRFNQESFALENLVISGQMLDENTDMIIVKGFTDLPKVQGYEKTLNTKSAEVIKIPANNYFTFIISEKNFSTLLKDKKVKKYQEFYKKNYSSTP